MFSADDGSPINGIFEVKITTDSKIYARLISSNSGTYCEIHVSTCYM